MSRVLVCGGRDYDDWRLLSETLSELHAERLITLVITGDARGADALAQRWANHAHVQVACYPPNWRFLGKKAGPIRNQAMIDHGKPDIVFAFPGGRGTEDMITRAIAARIPVRKVT